MPYVTASLSILGLSLVSLHTYLIRREQATMLLQLPLALCFPYPGLNDHKWQGQRVVGRLQEESGQWYSQPAPMQRG